MGVVRAEDVIKMINPSDNSYASDTIASKMKVMGYHAFLKKNESIQETEGLEIKHIARWVNMFHMPFKVTSCNEIKDEIIRIPREHYSTYADKMRDVVGIGYQAFAGNTDVKEIIIPNTVTSISEMAFMGCENLEKITIPKGVERIELGAFLGCDKLADVYYEGTQDEWDKIKIVHNKKDVKLGPLIHGTPVHTIYEDRLTYIPGNEALYTCNLHFRCQMD